MPTDVSSIDLSDEYTKFEIQVKPRGGKMKRFFSAQYHPKDLFVYRNGEISIRERSRDNNHML